MRIACELEITELVSSQMKADEDRIELARVAHRKEIYNLFP